MTRRLLFADCNPRWSRECWIEFDCPEGHEGCTQKIPVSPDQQGRNWQARYAVWSRVGNDLATVTIVPSIQRRPKYESREEAIAAGCVPELVTPAMLCACHVEVIGGVVNFCGDSK